MQTCPVTMSDELDCDRPIYHAPGSADPHPLCIMHCRETTKDPDKFRQEIHAILNGTSADHRPYRRFDFTGFVFPDAIFIATTFTQDADFGGATFTQDAYFGGATFTQDAYFRNATFAQKADFRGVRFTQNASFLEATFSKNADFFGAIFTQKATFSRATFTQNADFFGVTFTQRPDFIGATFTQDANFSAATFTQGANFFDTKFTQDADFSTATFTQQDANFRGTEFRRPERVRFVQVNQVALTLHVLHPMRRFYQLEQKRGAPGLRARFVNCRVEGVQFADVNWHREGGRMVLQDELDLMEPARPEEWRPTHELVAIAYRQLVDNFEKERAYDLAEDCKIGAMEMKRLDPKNFLFAKGLEAYYEKWRWLRWLGENLSTAGLYRWSSYYGTSYTRAFLVLLGLLVIFALLFATPWSAMQQEKPSPPPKVAVVAVPSTHWSAIQRGEPSPPPPLLGVWNRLGAGLFHSLEVATFQRDSLYGVPTRFGHFASTLETILVPAQLALFLLALRRRFRY